MQFDILPVVLLAAIIGIVVLGIIMRFIIEKPEEQPPPEWGPTISAPFRPSDDEMDRIPGMCPSCGAELSPYSVEWDPESGTAYCPDCKFPLRSR